MTDPSGRPQSWSGRSRDDEESESLRSQLATTDLSRHLALFYRTRAEQLATAAAYVARGIRSGERVVYIVDDNDPLTVTESFETAGLDVDALRESGQLSIRPAADTYEGDPFDPAESAESFRSLVAEAAAAGYDGLRVAGENTWTFGLDCGFDRVVEFERRFDRRCHDLTVSALCQYSLEQFGDDAIGKALQTHEQIVYRGEVCENPYYVPRIEAADDAPLSNAELLLEQTRDVDHFRRDIERREQRLSVVNRVLRHNLRNDINIVQGRIEWLEQQGALADDESVREQVETVYDAADRLLALSERARHVDRTLAAVDRGRADLDELAALAVADFERTHADIAVTVEAAPAGTVVADGAARVVLRELLSVVADRSDDASVTVTLGRDAEHGQATVEVAADEPFVLETTRAALSKGTEQSLQHAAGLGMWVAQWVTESMNGALLIPGSGPSDRVRFTVPTVSGDGDR